MGVIVGQLCFSHLTFLRSQPTGERSSDCCGGKSLGLTCQLVDTGGEEVHVSPRVSLAKAAPLAELTPVWGCDLAEQDRTHLGLSQRQSLPGALVIEERAQFTAGADRGQL